MPLNKAEFNLISSLLFLGLATVNVTHLHGKWEMNCRDCSFLGSSLFCSIAFIFFWARTFHRNYEQMWHPFLATSSSRFTLGIEPPFFRVLTLWNNKILPCAGFFLMNVVRSQTYTNIFKCTHKLTISHFIRFTLGFYLCVCSCIVTYICLVTVFETYHLCFYCLYLYLCVFFFFFFVHIPLPHVSNYPSILPFCLIVSSLLNFNFNHIQLLFKFLTKLQLLHSKPGMWTLSSSLMSQLLTSHGQYALCGF